MPVCITGQLKQRCRDLASLEEVIQPASDVPECLEPEARLYEAGCRDANARAKSAATIALPESLKTGKSWDCALLTRAESFLDGIHHDAGVQRSLVCKGATLAFW